MTQPAPAIPPRGPDRRKRVRRMVTDAYLQGIADHAKGVPLDANPFDYLAGEQGDDVRQLWELGWKEAAGGET